MIKSLIIFILLSLNVFSEKLDDSYRTKDIEISFENKKLKMFIHYPFTNQEFAEKVQEVLENDLHQIHQYFNYIPQSKIHFIIRGKERSANGSASVFPGNIITLHDFPPRENDSLSASKDWIKSLVIHEYIHILTLERTTGFLNFFRFFIGSSAKLTGIMPGWLAEGLATWGESFFTGEGRIHHPLIQSKLKQVLSSKKSCQHPSCFDSPKHYPYQQFRYWVGGYFLNYLESMKAGTIACLSLDQAKSIPLMLNGSWKRCTGQGLKESFTNFREKIINDKNIKTFKCPLENQKNCKKIEQKFRGVSWFKGFVESEELIAFSHLPNELGRAYGKKGEKLIIINKAKKKIQRIFLNYVIDRIYQSENSYFVSVWKSGKREHLEFDRNGLISSKGTSGKNCDEVINGKSKKCKYFESSRWSETKEGKKNPKRNVHLKESSDSKYKGYKYLLPEYLLVNAFFGNVSVIGIQTGVSDPLKRHNLLLNLGYTWGIDDLEKPIGGGAQYLYSRNDWNASIGYSKSYGQALGITNKYENTSVHISKNFMKDNKNFSLGLHGSIGQDFDAISGYQRETIRYGGSSSFSHKREKLIGFYRQFSLSSQFSLIKNKNFDAYPVISSQGHLSFDLRESWKLDLRSSYKKLLLGDNNLLFRDGIIYGGGINSFFTGNFEFPSYQKNFQEVLGEEMLRANIETSFRLFNIFKPMTFLGMHFKTINGFIGSEYLKTDFSLVINTDANGNSILGLKPDFKQLSAYVGLRLNMNLLYLLPLEIDMYGSMSEDELIPGVLVKTQLSF